MTMLRHAVAALCLTSPLLLLAGCSSTPTTRGTPRATPEELAVDYFKKTQDPTLTTHGKVRADTARSAGGNKIEYQTEDNRKWRVRYEKKDADYKYDTPEEVK